MKRSPVRVPVLALAAVWLIGGCIGEATASETVTLGGFVETDNRFTVEADQEAQFVWNENTLRLNLSASPYDSVRAFASADLVAVGADRELSLEDLQARDRADRYRIDLRDMYLEAYGLVLDDLDMRAGKQRIAWGTGDMFNPTDNINPDDLSDTLEFGEKVPTSSVMLTYYLGPLTITGVWIPVFEPAVFPNRDLRAYLVEQFEGLGSGFEFDTGNSTLDGLLDSFVGDSMADADLGALDVRAKLPSRALSNSSAAVKIGGNLGGYDLSASYYYGFDDIPTPRRVTVAASLSDLEDLDVEVFQEYPRIHVIGADMAGALSFLWDIGVWAEAAYFIPDQMPTEYYLQTDESLMEIFEIVLNEPISGDLRIGRDEPLENGYFKVVAGGDYTFKNGIYVNLQYVRGFPVENTEEMISNYLFGALERGFLHDTINVRLAGGWTMDDGSWAFIPEVHYSPMNALELSAHALFIGGDEDTRMGSLGEDTIVLKAKVSF